MAKKLSEITEIPKPSAEAIAEAEKHGAELRAYDPNRLEAFLAGQITLGDLEGIGKDAQYDMAKIGFGFFNEGKLDQAKTVFEGLLALDPFDAYFLTILGSIAHQKGEFEEAEARYSRALEINPFFASALAHRGEVRLANGDLAGAVQDFVEAIKQDPKGEEQGTIRANALLGTVQAQLEASEKDPAQAAAEARERLQSAGGNVAAMPGPVKKRPPTGKTPPPAGKKRPPTGKTAPPTGKERPPTGKTAPPTGKERPPTGKTAPPTGKERPPTGKTAPPRKKAPPGKKAPPRKK